MFHSIQPPAFIRFSVLVGHHPETFSLTLPVLSSKRVTVWPEVLAFSLLEVVLPSARILLPVVALHGPLPIEFVGIKGSLKYTAMLHKDSPPLSSVVQELTVIA